MINEPERAGVTRESDQRHLCAIRTDESDETDPAAQSDQRHFCCIGTIETQVPTA